MGHCPGSRHEYACVSGSQNAVLCVRSKRFWCTFGAFASFDSTLGIWMHRDIRVISLHAPVDPVQWNPMQARSKLR